MNAVGAKVLVSVTASMLVTDQGPMRWFGKAELTPTRVKVMYQATPGDHAWMVTAEVWGWADSGALARKQWCRDDLSDAPQWVQGCGERDGFRVGSGVV